MSQATMQQQKSQGKQNSSGNAVNSGNAKNKVKKTIPVAPGVVIMAVLLVVSLFVGNMRALQNASPASS